jgi:hypothetical protein
MPFSGLTISKTLRAIPSCSFRTVSKSSGVYSGCNQGGILAKTLVELPEADVDIIDCEPQVFPLGTLREFSTRVFLHFGCPKEDAVQAADVLACAGLRGIDSHGVARLHSYLAMPSDGGINPTPNGSASFKSEHTGRVL